MKEWLCLAFLLVGCEFKESDEEEDEEDSERNGSVFNDNDESGDPSSDCPSDVPEKYKYSWDCKNEQPGANGACSGKLYRYGVGESSADGNLTITEKWFVFNGPDDYCVDTFTLNGTWSSVSPATAGCSSCESIYDVQWSIQDSQCGVQWDPIFADQATSSPETMTYTGSLAFDTHLEWSLVNEDYSALVVSEPSGGDPNPNYAKAIATPSYDAESDGKDNDGDGEIDNAGEQPTAPWDPDDLKVSDPWVDGGQQTDPLEYTFEWANVEADCLQ